MKNLTKRSLIVCMTLLLIISLCGCRESNVLQQILYTDDASEVDEDTEELDSDDEGEEDDDLVNEVTDDSDTVRDTDDTLAVSDSDSDGDGESTDVTYSEYGSDNGDTTSETGTSSESTSDSDSDESSGTESGGTTTTDNATDSGPKQTVTDGTGTQIEIPTDADKVAAIGAAAEMVAMVAGIEYLEFANSDFINSDVAQTVFSSGISNVTSLWSGDGTSSCSNISTLLNSDVDVCFYFSGDSTLTSDQISQLTAAGITCVALYAMDDEDDLKNNVTIVATAFSTTTDGASTTEASEYGSWVDNAISEVSSKVGSTTLYSIYISGWSSSSYSLTENYSSLPSDLITGSGIATAWSLSKAELISTFMETAGVYNTSVLYPGTRVTTESEYVTPMFRRLGANISDTSITYFTNFEGGWDAFLYYDSSTTLGSSNFPAIIVANSTIKSNIENNWFWQTENNVNAQENYGISGSITGDYEIYVNPYGICDWAEGCVESPLEAYWVAYVISGVYTLEDVETEISDFYSEFFEYDLSESTINNILDGE